MFKVMMEEVLFIRSDSPHFPLPFPTAPKAEKERNAHMKGRVYTYRAPLKSLVMRIVSSRYTTVTLHVGARPSKGPPFQGKSFHTEFTGYQRSMRSPDTKGMRLTPGVSMTWVFWSSMWMTLPFSSTLSASCVCVRMSLGRAYFLTCAREHTPNLVSLCVRASVQLAQRSERASVPSRPCRRRWAAA